MRSVIMLIGVLTLTLPAVAMEPIQIPPSGPCTFAWNYEPHPLLASFAVFMRAEGESYSKLPVKIVPALETMTLAFPCEAIRFFGPGVYYLFIRAEGIAEEVSPRSNEIAVRVGAPQPLAKPPVPTPPKPLPSSLPPAPEPLVAGPPVTPPVVMPPTPRGSPWASDSCQWQGNCRR